MRQRDIVQTVRGRRTTDGAGVRLVRVLSAENTAAFDPFLMLDSFDSTDPADYVAGFPTHPHRGIETITYLIQGEIEHEDSLGNKDTIRAGESQWMTAGSGILHQEMPLPSARMLGLQLWLNLPRAEKMADPAYLSITDEMMPTVVRDQATVRVLSGSFDGAAGVTPRHIPASVFDVSLHKNGRITLPAPPELTAFVFLIQGDGLIAGERVPEKTAVLFGEGDAVTVEATADLDLRFLFFTAKPLHEPIAWGGPIVMNTQEELRQAFDELRRGVFIRR